jgi:hypothetical protein
MKAMIGAMYNPLGKLSPFDKRGDDLKFLELLPSLQKIFQFLQGENFESLVICFWTNQSVNEPYFAKKIT